MVCNLFQLKQGPCHTRAMSMNNVDHTITKNDTNKHSKGPKQPLLCYQ